MKSLISINGLNKNYDSGFSLNNIDLKIKSGTIVGLIGENGAGKTTLIKSILDIIKKDSGIIDLNLDKEEIGVVLDNMFFPELLNALDINISMKDIYSNWDSELFFSYLKKFNVPFKEKIKVLSKGTRKKLEIATALAHKPKLLILDEPTSGLDPIIRNEILDIFADFTKEKDHAILLSSHITTDLEKVANKIIFIDNGNKILEEDLNTLMQEYKIITCSTSLFDQLDKEKIIAYRKIQDNVEFLVNSYSKKDYKKLKTENATLEAIMLIIIKGEK